MSNQSPTRRTRAAGEVRTDTSKFRAVFKAGRDRADAASAPQGRRGEQMAATIPMPAAEER
jgi:hypothetical protein